MTNHPDLAAIGDAMDVYRERLGDALHRVAHPHHPWSGCAYPDLFYDKLTHFMGDLAACGLTVRPAILADTPSVEPAETTEDAAFEAELAAQQAEDNRIDAWIDQQPEWGEHR